MQERFDDGAIGADALKGRGVRDPFASAMRATQMPMVLSDPHLPDHPIVFANEAFERLTGYDRGEIIGRNCRFLQGADSDSQAVGRIRAALAAAEPVEVDILNYRKDGSSFWNALYISPVRDDGGAVRFFFGSQLDVSDRVEAQRRLTAQKAIVEDEVRRRTADLQAALEAKTALLQEVDHRVKNNLTMVGSLLRLQSRSIPDPRIRTTLESMLTRVYALSTVHRRLYQTDDLERFDVGTFAASLVRDVVKASGRSDIEIQTDLAPAFIPLEHAAAVGLIVNEFVTNAIKHAFANGRSGVLGVAASTCGAGVRIEVRDDGEGFDAATGAPVSIGRALVDRLSRQIGATITTDGARPGTHVVIDLPVKARA